MKQNAQVGDSLNNLRLVAVDLGLTKSQKYKIRSTFAVAASDRTV